MTKLKIKFIQNKGIKGAIRLELLNNESGDSIEDALYSNKVITNDHVSAAEPYLYLVTSKDRSLNYRAMITNHEYTDLDASVLDTDKFGRVSANSTFPNFVELRRIEQGRIEDFDAASTKKDKHAPTDSSFTAAGNYRCSKITICRGASEPVKFELSISSKFKSYWAPVNGSIGFNDNFEFYFDFYIDKAYACVPEIIFNLQRCGVPLDQDQIAEIQSKFAIIPDVENRIAATSREFKLLYSKGDGNIGNITLANKSQAVRGLKNDLYSNEEMVMPVLNSQHLYKYVISKLKTSQQTLSNQAGVPYLNFPEIKRYFSATITVFTGPQGTDEKCSFDLESSSIYNYCTSIGPANLIEDNYEFKFKFDIAKAAVCIPEIIFTLTRCGVPLSGSQINAVYNEFAASQEHVAAMEVEPTKKLKLI